MLLGDVPKGVARLQIRIFPLKNKEMRARELFPLFNSYARVKYLFCAIMRKLIPYGTQHDFNNNLNLELSVSERAHAQLSNMYRTETRTHHMVKITKTLLCIYGHCY